MSGIKCKRILVIIFGLIIRDILLVTILIHSAFLQSFLTKQIIVFFSKTYDINLSVENVYIKLPNTIQLTGVYLTDSIGDTLVYSQEINAKISELKLLDKKIYIEQISLNEPFINIVVDSAGNSNYKFILNKFASEDEDTTTSESFDIFCNNFEIINARFKYKDLRYLQTTDAINFSDINISGFNITIRDFEYLNDSISLNLSKLSVDEKSGLNIKEFSTNILYCNSGIFLKDFILKTKYSEFLSSEISLEGVEEDYLSDPLNKMKVKILIDTLIFDIADLGPFLPEYRYLHDKVYFSGDFTGKLSNFKLKNFNISYGQDTRLIANLSVDGLPDYDMTFIFGDVSKLTTSSPDVTKMLKIFSPTEPVVLPEMIDELGYLSFNGNITGLFNDLVAYGEFNTGLGTIRTDMAIVTDFETFDIAYNGKLQANKINIGEITGYPDTFGMLSLSSTLNGTLDSTGNFRAMIDCDISELGILDYYYSGIKVKGDISNNFFNGELYVNDPNLQVEFIGKYNYGADNQELAFSSDIYANLNNLNITNDSLPSELKIVISSDIKGDILNTPEGNVFISDLTYTSNGQTLRLNQLSLNSYRDEYEQQFLTIRSDYADINLYGIFEYGELGTTVYNMLAGYTPTFIDKIEVEESKSDNIANFDIRLKALENLTNVFIPELSIEGEIFAEGKISGINNELDAIFSIPVIKYDSIYLWGSELNINAYKDSLDLYLTIQEISTKSFPWFENMLLKLDVENDSVFMNMNWDNYDTERNSGNIGIATRFVSVTGQNFPKIENIIQQSEVIVSNRVWEIKQTPVTIDSTNIKISNFSLSHENQVLNIDGEISEDPSKLVRFLINNVDITNFNPYIESTGYELKGILSGNGRVANIYSNPLFRATMSIKDFKINDEDFGRFDLSAIWEDNATGLKVDGVNKYMKIRGNYLPEADSIDFNFTMDNFKLEMLEPYLTEYEVSGLAGMVDIELKVSGLLSDLNIDGYIDFEKAEFIYDFLKVHVFTDDKILITNDAILFKDFKIYDEYKNPGIISGGVYYNKFSDIRFDLMISAEKMKLLNTTEQDNSLYYGTAYGTGTVKISGDIDNFGIDVVAKSEPNTVFVLPMTEYYESSSVSYVTFVQRETDSLGDKILTTPESEMNYYFKMDVEVTPDAEAQIVFDPKVGDVLRGFCSGDIKMEYTSDEEFYMYGELEVIEGDYLFTLENVINKKFHIKPGGTILWSGDPYEADLNLDAVYYAKAPLFDLMADVADSSDVYTKPISVECNMHMSGSLMAPDILFSINIPNANDKVKTVLANMSQDDINKQLLYLLILNKFYSATQSATGGPQLGNTTDAFGVTSAELLSNQLSNWLSQISKDFDIGFKYRPGTDVSGQELEVALSTQILNDRVLINGNVGVGENKSTTSNLIGDIEVQLKVNKSGSFRLKGFTRANDDMQAEFGPYTSGVGIFYTQDFNTFGELFTKMWHAITFKNYRNKRKNNSQSYLYIPAVWKERFMDDTNVTNS